MLVVARKKAARKKAQAEAFLDFWAASVRRAKKLKQHFAGGNTVQQISKLLTLKSLNLKAPCVFCSEELGHCAQKPVICASNPCCSVLAKPAVHFVGAFDTKTVSGRYERERQKRPQSFLLRCVPTRRDTSPMQ